MINDIKNGLDLLVDDMIDLEESSIKIGSDLNELFPAFINKIVTINGKKYSMSMEVKLKEIKC